MITDRRRLEFTHSFFFLAALSLATAGIGCGGSPPSTGTSPKTISGVSISPGTANVAIGTTKQFAATATYSDGSTANVTATAAWSSSKAAVIKINSAGLGTAMAAGSASITATLNGASGTATVTVPAPTVKSIVVSPANASVPIAATQQFTATATYSDGTTGNVTSTATWSSENSAVVKINAAGVATAVAAGSVSITATLNGATGMANVIVPAPTVTAIVVSPPSANLSVNATQQFTAMATYSNGLTANVTATALWSSANSAVVKVNAAGLATAVAAGSTGITASFGGASGMATVVVAAPTVQSIAVSPSGASVVAGSTQQFTATATYSNGTTGNVSATATWSSSNPAVMKVTAGGLATAVAAGSATITATLNGGTSGMTSVTVSAPTLKSIAVSPADANISVNATQQFTATATYSNGTTANVTATALWSSANNAVVKVNAAGLATAVAAGSATITATLTGASGMATVTVPALPVQSIAVSPSGANIVVGSTQQFTATATYSNGSTGNVTSTAIWSSSNPAVMKVSAGGLATAVAAGSVSITATLSSGTSGMTSVTVAAPTLKSIAVSPADGNISIGATQQFTATATYSNGTTANVTATVTWAAATPTIATINTSGVASGIATGSTSITATMNGTQGAAVLNVSPKTATSIAVTPNPASFSTGATQQFTATATYSDGSKANVTSTVAWTVANTAVATISSGGLATAVASGSSTVTASQNGVSGQAAITITIAATTGVNIPTFHGDALRSGLNAKETSLTPTNVTSKTFGKLFSYLVDGYVYGEPLLMSNITINGKAHNVLYAATENDSVYAFDADSYGSGTPLWQVSLLQSGETPLGGGDIVPVVGVTSTPVIDPTSNTMYVVSAQKSSNGATFRLNALDITSGAQKFGGPVTITASVAGTNSQSVNGVVTLTDACIQRAALLLANGQIYIGFGSCHDGWLLAYNAQTLARTAIFNTSPNLNGEGTYSGAGGIWMGGGGPDADSSGNVYVTTGNGPWDGKTAWADSVLKFNAQLQMQDYFTPQDFQFMDCKDLDLAAGGLLLIPGTTEALAGGKMGKMYLVNTNNLGHEQANDAGATQALWFESDIVPVHTDSCVDATGTNTAVEDYSQIYGTAAYFNGSVYLGVVPVSTVPAGVRRFTYASGVLTPGSYTSPSVQESSYGTTPFISANGTSDGILWMIDHGVPLDESPTTTATLRAYDATDLTDQLYNSSINSSDVPGYGIKFTSPIVANGKVYISTGHDPITATKPRGELDVYGLK